MSRALLRRLRRRFFVFQGRVLSRFGRGLRYGLGLWTEQEAQMIAADCERRMRRYAITTIATRDVANTMVLENFFDGGFFTVNNGGEISVVSRDCNSKQRHDLLRSIEGISDSAVRRYAKRSRKRIGIPGFMPHGLKADLMTKAGMNGVLPWEKAVSPMRAVALASRVPVKARRGRT